jgi:hypothetical protein
VSRQANKSDQPGDFNKFKDFMRRLVAVPHAEIKAKLDAEKAAKQRKQRPSGHASRAKGS